MEMTVKANVDNDKKYRQGLDKENELNESTEEQKEGKLEYFTE